jgi:hypothetical protein
MSTIAENRNKNIKTGAVIGRSEPTLKFYGCKMRKALAHLERQRMKLSDLRPNTDDECPALLETFINETLPAGGFTNREANVVRTGFNVYLGLKLLSSSDLHEPTHIALMESLPKGRAGTSIQHDRSTVFCLLCYLEEENLVWPGPTSGIANQRFLPLEKIINDAQENGALSKNTIKVINRIFGLELKTNAQNKKSQYEMIVE